MPAPADTEEQTVAAAFILLYGNPPKAVKYRGGMFSFRSHAAHEYKHQLQRYVKLHLPRACETKTGMPSLALAEQARNRCLRYIMGVDP